MGGNSSKQKKKASEEAPAQVSAPPAPMERQGSTVASGASQNDIQEWETQIKKQHDSAAWHTTVEQQNITARFSTIKSRERLSQSRSQELATDAQAQQATAQQAEVPAQQSEAPTQQPEAPVQQTEAPAQQAEAPAPQTEAPAQQTEASAQPAEAPSQDAQAPPQPQESKSSSVIFVLGGPGSGKGTACEKIAQEFGFTHLSSGELLREEAAKETELGKEIAELMKEGKLVPAETTVKVLQQAMHDSATKGYLLDGFPRSLAQAEMFDKTVGKGLFALYYSCSEEVMLQRLRARAETSGRADDNEETMQKRLVTFREETLPIVDYFKQDGRLIEISAEGTKEEVQNATREAITSKGIQTA